MKKTFILSAAAVAAMGVNAEVIDYDFNTNPEFCKILYLPEAEDGWAWSGEYDFIDKTGTAINTDNTIFNVKDDEGNWQAVKNFCISLVDGGTYTLEGTVTTSEMEYTQIDKSAPFICWNQDGKGPARTHLFNGWNNTETYEDKDYGAGSEADFIASKGAIGFLRNGNTGSRTDTYIQFPAVKSPTKLTVWIGNQGGSYHDKGLTASIATLVDGEVIDESYVGEDIDATTQTSAYKSKRYYKFDATLPDGLTGKDVAFRVGCRGSQVSIFHVRIETADDGQTGIEDIIVNEAEDENAPIYNILGIQVDETYKGIVIKNGKKYIQQ